MGRAVTTIFLVAIALWLGLLRASVGARTTNRCPPLRAALLVIVPVLAAVLLLLTTKGDAGALRVRLGAVRYLIDHSASPNRIEVTVGGEDETVGAPADTRYPRPSDFYVPRLPPDFARLSASKQPDGSWQVRATYLRAGTPGGTKGIIAVGDRQNDWTVVSGVELAAGDIIDVDAGARRGRIELMPAARIKVIVSEPAQSERVLTLSNLIITVPFFEVAYPTFKKLNSAQRTYALDGLLKQAAAIGVPDEPDLLSSFFYFSTDPFGWSGRLHLAVLDPGVRVIRAGAPLFVPSELVIAEGATIRFAGLGRQNRALPSPFDRTGIRDFRSVAVRLHREQDTVSALSLKFDRPEVLSFTPAHLARLREDGERDTGSLLALSLVPNTISDRSVAFSALSDRFVAGGEATVEVHDDGRTVDVLTPAGVLKAAFGEGVWLGDSAQGLVQLDRIAPRMTLAFAIICIICTNAVLLVALGVLDRRALLVLSSVTGLLALRLLLGFKSFNQFPADDKSLGLAVVALAAVPWVLTSVFASGNSRPLNWVVVPHVGAAFVAFFIAKAMLSSGAAWAVLGGLIAAGAPLWVQDARRMPSWISRVAGSIGSTRVVVSTMSIIRRIWGPFSGVITYSPTALGSLIAALLLGGGLLVLRGIGVALGVRERLPIPGIPFAVSVLFTPALLWAYSLLLSRWERRAYHPWWVWLLSVALFGATGCVLVGMLVSDLGIPLLLGFVLLWHAMLVAKETFSLKTRTIAVILASALILVGGAVIWVLRTDVARIESAQGAEQLPMERFSRNWLRLLHAAYPETLDKIGTRDSDNLAIMHEVMNTYRASSFFGRGYPSGEVTTVLGPTILREHVPSVYVLADFGHVGMLLLVALYAIPLWVFRYGAALRSPHGISVTEHFGPLCFTAFSISSLYMLLANYNVVPFTGKNAYLLGLDSIGDLFEATLLLALGAAVYARAVRRQAVAPAAVTQQTLRRSPLSVVRPTGADAEV